jgi:hypothetical protein
VAKIDSERERYLDQILTLPQAAHERTVSLDTLRKEIKRGNLKVLRLSARRVGMTRREALRPIP